MARCGGYTYLKGRLNSTKSSHGQINNEWIFCSLLKGKFVHRFSLDTTDHFSHQMKNVSSRNMKCDEKEYSWKSNYLYNWRRCDQTPPRWSDTDPKSICHFRCGISKSQLLIPRSNGEKWLWKILTFGGSQHFKALKGHLAPLTIIYALKYW